MQSLWRASLSYERVPPGNLIISGVGVAKEFLDTTFSRIPRDGFFNIKNILGMTQCFQSPNDRALPTCVIFDLTTISAILKSLRQQYLFFCFID